MERNHFLRKLDELLARVPEKDRKEMLYDYEEHFSVGLANGKTEAEIVSELGDPYVIARDLLTDYRQMRVEQSNSIEFERMQQDQIIFHADKKSSPSQTVNSTIAAIGLGFFNLVFVLGPLLGLLGAFIGLWASAFIMLISPLFTILSLFTNDIDETILIFFISLIFCGLGILLSVGLSKLGKYSLKGLRSYVQFNMKIIRGEKGEVRA